MPRPPLGQRVHLSLVTEGRDTAVASEAPTFGFRHSALCEMSLSGRHPADDAQPVIRQDGRKFHQTVRDAWKRQVSAVYPEAWAEFDSTIICLLPSPPPARDAIGLATVPALVSA